jgi:hypothetical protein
LCRGAWPATNDTGQGDGDLQRERK